MESAKKQHFVLVHGSGLGAWTYYKVIPLLREAGHRVSALDLSGCGINPRQYVDLTSIYDYLQPLTDFMASLPDDEKVVLVGHSYGGFGIALTTEKFPEKILVAVYVTAYMPNYTSPPALLQEEFFRRTPTGNLSDTQLWYDDGPENLPTSILFGPNFLAANLSPPYNVELARVLVRRNGFFLKDLGKENLLTKKNFGSVKRVFVLTGDDPVLTRDFQEYMIENSPPDDVKVIDGADHMVLMTKPNELYLSLQEIAEKY